MGERQDPEDIDRREPAPQTEDLSCCSYGDLHSEERASTERAKQPPLIVHKHARHRALRRRGRDDRARADPVGVVVVVADGHREEERDRDDVARDRERRPVARDDEDALRAELELESSWIYQQLRKESDRFAATENILCTVLEYLQREHFEIPLTPSL